MLVVILKQKINKVKLFGKEYVEVIFVGDIFDEVYQEVLKVVEEGNMIFVYFFNDRRVIEGQGMVGLEIEEDCFVLIDYIFVVIGGGGFILGLGSYFKQISLDIKIIGVELVGVLGMVEFLKVGKVIKLEKIDNFVDGVVV